MPTLLGAQFTPPTIPGTFVSVDSGELPPTNFLGTFSFGADDATRLIVAVIHWRLQGSDVPLLSVTIDGLAATIHVQDSHTGGSTGLGAAIISRAGTSGTSGDINCNFDGPVSEGFCSVYRATNLVSNNPFAVAEVRGYRDTDVNVNVSVPANGVLLAAGTGSTGINNANATFTGVTELYDFDAISLRCSAGLTVNHAGGVQNVRYSFGDLPDAGVELCLATWQLQT